MARPTAKEGSVLQRLRENLVEPNKFHYSAAICKCAWRPALQTLQVMQARGCEPDMFCWNGCLGACKGRWDLGLALLRAARRTAQRPDEFSYGSLAGRWSTTLAGLAEAKGVVRFKEAAERQFSMNIFRAQGRWREVLLAAWSCTLDGNLALSVCEKASRWEEGVGLLERMSGEQIRRDVISFNTVIAATHSADWLLSARSLERLQESELRPDAITCSTCISCAVKQQRWTRALHLATLGGRVPTPAAFAPWRWACRLLRGDANPAVAAGLAVAASRAQQWQQALRLAEVPREDEVLGNALVEAWAMGRLWQKLTTTYGFNNAISMSEWMSGLQLYASMPWRRVARDAVSHGAALAAAAAAGGRRWRGALRLWPRRAQSASVAMAAAKAAGRWEMAWLLHSGMASRGASPDWRTHTVAVEKTKWRHSVQILAVDSLTLAALLGAQEWHRGLQLLFLARPLRVALDEGCYNACSGLGWARALGLSDAMRLQSLEPSAVSLAASCPGAGSPDLLARLAAVASARLAASAGGRGKRRAPKPGGLQTWHADLELC
ncbi:unnamed protein product [Effrenium voratum]|nr:unnamed protein product [Effrenium voratum]